MNIIMKSFVVTAVFLSVFSAYGIEKEEEKKPVIGAITNKLPLDVAKRTRFVGNILKNTLESYHYRKLKIDDDVSKKAFKQLLERIDFGKQFFLKSDVRELEQYEVKMDDQMVSGKMTLVEKANFIFEQRLSLLEEYRKEVFKKGFDFEKDESIEVDPKKRKFVEGVKALKELWRKNFKHSVINRYLTLKQEQEDRIKKEKEEKGKKKDKKKEEKKEKILTLKEMKEKSIELISKKYKKLFERYRKERAEERSERFFNSIASIFDPHTTYLPPKRKEDFDIDISGSLEGIGAVLQEDESYIKVVEIIPGGAAWRQKELQVGDHILFVREGDEEPVDLVDMRVDDAVRYIRGKKGTEVRLTVKSADGTQKTIPIVRDVVKIQESFAKSSVIEHKKLGKKVGYIQVPKFYRDFGKNTRNCSTDVRNEIERLNKVGVDGLILDLRNNGGGALDDARIMSGLFIPKGPIVQVKDHRDRIEILKDTDGKTYFDKPLIVLINRFSASASEILAAAMQDYKRAVIVGGEHTHGKGTVQAVLDLNQGPFVGLFGKSLGALKITIQKFYRVNGSSTQYKGVTPDIILPDVFGHIKSREQDLDYSLPWDKVKPLKYKEQKITKKELKKLIEKSKKRVNSSNRFSMIKENLEYLKKRQDDTLISIKMSTLIEENEKHKKLVEKYKLEEQLKDIDVSHYEKSLMPDASLKKQNEKAWKEDFEKRKTEWIEYFRKDPVIEESLYIMNDMISMKI